MLVSVPSLTLPDNAIRLRYGYPVFQTSKSSSESYVTSQVHIILSGRAGIPSLDLIPKQKLFPASLCYLLPHHQPGGCRRLSPTLWTRQLASHLCVLVAFHWILGSGGLTRTTHAPFPIPRLFFSSRVAAGSSSSVKWTEGQSK